DIFQRYKVCHSNLGVAQASECYNITSHSLISMTRRIMLHKNTLLCAGLGAVFLFAQVPLASAAVVTSMKPLGFIAAAIAD
nr:hypothetical protein [Streptococcus agalactiae]